MNLQITFPESKMEFDVPEKKLELVKTLLFELASGAQNTPKS